MEQAFHGSSSRFTNPEMENTEKEKKKQRYRCRSQRIPDPLSNNATREPSCLEHSTISKTNHIRGDMMLGRIFNISKRIARSGHLDCYPCLSSRTQEKREDTIRDESIPPGGPFVLVHEPEGETAVKEYRRDVVTEIVKGYRSSKKNYIERHLSTYSNLQWLMISQPFRGALLYKKPTTSHEGKGSVEFTERTISKSIQRVYIGAAGSGVPSWWPSFMNKAFDQPKKNRSYRVESIHLYPLPVPHTIVVITYRHPCHWGEEDIV